MPYVLTEQITLQSKNDISGFETMKSLKTPTPTSIGE